MLAEFLDLLGSGEPSDTASDTASLCLSGEVPILDVEPAESDILLAFGDSVLASPVEAPVQVLPPETPELNVEPSSYCDYVHGAKTYTAKAFNMLFGMAMVVTYHGDVSVRIPGTLLGDFCGDLGLEQKILLALGSVDGFVTRRGFTDANGVQWVEVAIRRSVLVRLFKYDGNDSGSSRLSEIFLGGAGKPRSSANIRKIWGSLTRDISRASSNKLRTTPGFIKKIGYRRVSAKNCEFVLVLPASREVSV